MDSKRSGFAQPGLAWLLALPQLVIVLVFFYWPAVQAVWQSLYLEDAFGLGREFVGLENFTRLFRDPNYLQSMQTTALFSVSVAGLALVTSLLLAWCAYQAMRARLVFRTLLIWPYAVAPAVAGVLWVFLFNPSIGIATYWLARAGIVWNHVLDGRQAMALVVFAAAWKQISYNFVFFLAGLQAVPKALIEAAAIDGAGRWRTFRSVILPLLAPTTFFLLVVNVVYAFFDTFPIIDSITHGGPGNATEILVYKVYRDGYKGLDLGSSSAQSVILMLIVVLLTWVQFRFVEKKVPYQ